MPAILRRIAENWKLKILAFGMGVLLWVVVSAEQVTSEWIWVPLQIQVTDPNYQLVASDAPEEVQVRFTGPGRDLLDVSLRRPPLRLGIAEVGEPIETRTLDPRMVQLPGQVSVNALDVRPNAVRLEFVRMESVDVPIRVRISAELGPDRELASAIQLSPERVVVSGPAERVRGVSEVSTIPLQLTDVDTIFDRAVPLDTTALRGLELSTRSVNVSGRIDSIVERTLQGVGVDVGPGVEISPTAVSVTLRGPQPLVEAVAPGTFRVVISISEIPSQIPEGGVAVPLRIAGLRSGVEAEISPASVRLFPAEPDEPVEPDEPEPPATGLVPRDTADADAGADADVDAGGEAPASEPAAPPASPPGTGDAG